MTIAVEFYLIYVGLMWSIFGDPSMEIEESITIKWSVNAADSTEVDGFPELTVVRGTV